MPFYEVCAPDGTLAMRLKKGDFSDMSTSEIESACESITKVIPFSQMEVIEFSNNSEYLQRIEDQKINGFKLKDGTAVSNSEYADRLNAIFPPVVP